MKDDAYGGPGEPGRPRSARTGRSQRQAWLDGTAGDQADAPGPDWNAAQDDPWSHDSWPPESPDWPPGSSWPPAQWSPAAPDWSTESEWPPAPAQRPHSSPPAGSGYRGRHGGRPDADYGSGYEPERGQSRRGYNAGPGYPGPGAPGRAAGRHYGRPLEDDWPAGPAYADPNAGWPGPGHPSAHPGMPDRPDIPVYREHPSAGYTDPNDSATGTYVSSQRAGSPYVPGPTTGAGAPYPDEVLTTTGRGRRLGTDGFPVGAGRQGESGWPGGELDAGSDLFAGADDGGRRVRNSRRRRSFVALLVTLVLLGLLGIGGLFGYDKLSGFFLTKDYKGSGYGSVTVKINDGDSLTTIANTLYTDHVVRSAKAFTNAAAKNKASLSVAPGDYRLHLHMQANLALGMLLAKDANGRLVNRITTTVTIPEGMITIDIYAKLAKATGLPLSSFLSAAKNPVALGIPSWWFKRTDGKKAATSSLEGFLYPATYDLDPGLSATDILKQMVNQFLTVTGGMKFADTVQNKLHISPYEALVAASIAQVEAVFPADMTGVTRVLYNRVYSGKFACNCLQLDSEVNYWLRISGKKAQDSGNLTNSQLHDPRDPYNTHDSPGMPLGPISNPGKDALTAAMSPMTNPAILYFLAIDTKGHIAFAKTDAEFCQDINKAISNGVHLAPC